MVIPAKIPYNILNIIMYIGSLVGGVNNEI
jgi:hypothetical protein